MSNLLNKKAPAVTLPDENGGDLSLEDFKGQYILLYFYPKDMTPGCTEEAQCLRNRMNDLKALDVQVIGVSADSSESHKKFRMKERLNFPLLSDVDKKVIQAYGVWKEKNFLGKKFMGISRESFLIDPKGVIVKHYEKVKPAEHAEEVISDVKLLRDMR